MVIIQNMRNRIQQAFSRLSIKNKMYLAIIPAILLLMTVFFLVFGIMYRNLRENAVQTNFQLLSLVEKDAESEINSLRSSASPLLSNQSVKDYVSSEGSDSEKKKLIGISKELMQGTHINSFMVIKSPSDYVYTRLGKVFPDIERQELATFICEHINEINGPFVLSSQESAMMYLVMSLADSALEHKGIYTGGLLAVCASRSFLSNIAANYDLGQNLLIYDGFDNLIWGTPATDTVYDNVRLLNSGNYSSSEDRHSDMMYLSHHCQSLNWRIVIQQPLSSLTAELRRYELLFLVAACIAIILALGTISIISSFNTKRIQELTSVIKNIQEGDIDCRYPVHYQDEISTIGSEFNKMFDEIQTYQITAAQQSLKQRDAELHALQSQINPHFLYNSLDCIRSEALVNGDKVTAEQIQILASMFRYTVGKEDNGKLVPIRAEIGHVDDYLSMLKYRFRDRFTFTMEVQPDIMLLKTPKLILQPVVENSFTHGIRNMLEGGLITVTGEKKEEESCVLFVVMDNGVGIPEDKLLELTEHLSGSPLSTKNASFMGLVNTNDRIRLAFGTGYGVTIQSKENEGTRVEIRIPIEV